MKKYITPEIETLALETVDVITNSVFEYAAADLVEEYGIEASQVQELTKTVEQMRLNTWSW